MKSTVFITSALFWLAGSTATAEPLSLEDLNQRLADGRTTRIVCFGDSITGVYYHSGGQRAWCDILGLALQKANPHARLQMINAGISGHTTVNALSRIEKDVIARQPHLVVVMFGMNDVTRVPLQTYRDNMRTISRRCLEVGAAVVLCTPNSVYENVARPNAKLAEFSEVVREIAGELRLPVVDCFQDWQRLRADDPAAWRLLMSDDIHPNMTGHIRFAELITDTVCGRRVSLTGTAPPHDALQHTFDRLNRKESVRLVAMAPYDEIVPELLRRDFPDASFDVTIWPTTGNSLSEMEEWAKRIRGLEPHLVVSAVPADASATSREACIKSYEWVLNYSFPFGGRLWDVVPVESRLTADPSLEPDLAEKIILGKDVRFISNTADAGRSPRDVAATWIDDQKRAWLGARQILPSINDSVFLPAQSWPQQPGPRTVRISVHYPTGKLESVNEQTGIMLTLHNWGGEDCAGTANPDTLAKQLNVVAICVNYLQSGRQASIEAPEPYDCGYLQALDALRALAYVRNGLQNAEKVWDHGRTFCTGGSGGGNVTLMANKLAPRTFACIIDMCGMKKLSDDIAFNLPGGTSLNARWSRDPESVNFLTPDEQSIRFVGQPSHLAVMKALQATSKIIVVHGVADSTCPFADAQELVANLQAAELDVEPHFITEDDLDGRVFTSAGHGLGNRTEIVLQVGKDYLAADGARSLRRTGPSDFERGEEIRYPTPHGAFVILYAGTYPEAHFEPTEQ